MTDQADFINTLFEFPCSFPIKVMGLPHVGLEDFIKDTLKAHVKNHPSIDIKVRESTGGNYISITGTFEAESREQLDTIYKIFTAHPHVKMVL